VRNTIKLAVIVLAGSILGTACVTSGTFEAKEAELAKALKENDSLSRDNAKLQATFDNLNKQIADLKWQMDRVKAYGKGKADEAGQLRPPQQSTVPVCAICGKPAVGHCHLRDIDVCEQHRFFIDQEGKYGRAGTHWRCP
jgi:hypothetical protein